MPNFANSKSVTFFDTEVTSLDINRSALLDITIVTDWEDGGQKVFTTKVKPTARDLELADEEALKIVGYSDELWKDAPTFDEVAPEIAKRLKWGPIVAHNAIFDYRQLASIFTRNGWTEVFSGSSDVSKKQFSFASLIYDTRALAHIFLECERQNMQVLREHFGLSDKNAHSSLKDTADCRTIFYNIISKTLGQNA
jgi:DNA polymerase III epsilon subunit-like protein